MTPLQELRLARSEILRSQLARKEAESRSAAALSRSCSRCKESVQPEDLCPGRYWCRTCENKRRRRCYHARQQVAA